VSGYKDECIASINQINQPVNAPAVYQLDARGDEAGHAVASVVGALHLADGLIWWWV
jgi:hypothetical protein